jgi:hypothetical protein
MDKVETYRILIDITKKTGQGLTGIVKIKNPEVGIYLEELIQEGLIKACHTGGSLGTRESNIFYMPIKGYNVWEDEPENSNSIHKGFYLNHVRFHLGILPEVQSGKFDVTEEMLRSNQKWMENYNKWLEKNHEELEIMKTLDDNYHNVLNNDNVDCLDFNDLLK